jgi:uncharacterized protein YndB with AHSA1/START domain
MNEQPSGLLLELECVLEAPRDRIFGMLTDAVALAKWWGPRGFTMPHAELDLRVGGHYRFTMKPPGGDVFHLSGEYLEIRPPSRLVFSFRWDEPTPDDRETIAELSLETAEMAETAGTAGAATKLSLSQGSFATEERRALHANGWTESFERLRELIASG